MLLPKFCIYAVKSRAETEPLTDNCRRGPLFSEHSKIFLSAGIRERSKTRPQFEPQLGNPNVPAEETSEVLDSFISDVFLRQENREGQP